MNMLDMTQFAASACGIKPASKSGVQILPDLPAREYHALSELSRGTIHTISTKGLAVWNHERTEPKRTTDSMDFGTVCHSIAFGKPDDELHIYRGLDRRTKEGKEEWELVQDHAIPKGLLPVKSAVYEEACNVVEAFQNCEEIKAILKADASRELTVIWPDDETGMDCRARFDFLPHPVTMPILDLKVVASLPESPAKWAWTAMKFGYDIQAYHYTAGAVAAGFGLREFWFVLVEDHAPYETAVFRLTDDWLARASGIRRRVARDLQVATLDGVYPKRYRGVIDVAPPFGCDGGEE